MPRHSELTVEQRREAVLALLRREEPAVQLARRFVLAQDHVKPGVLPLHVHGLLEEALRCHGEELGVLRLLPPPHTLFARF